MAKGKKEAVYSFVWSIASKVITYFLLLVMANLYLKEEFGRASFVMSAFNLAALFAFMGLSSIFTVWYIKKKDCSSIFYFLAILTGLFFIASLIISIYHPWILALALCWPFVFFMGVSGSILRAKYKYDLIQLNSTVFMLIVLLGAFFMTSLGKTGIIIAYALSYLITSIWLIWVTRKELRNIMAKVRIKVKSIKGYLVSAVVTTLIFFAFSFLGWTDVIILGWLSTFENVAKYNIVGPISNVLTLIPLSLGAFLLTRTSELKNKKISFNVLNRVLRVSYTFSFIVAIALISLLPLLFRLFFPAYIGNEIFVMILSIGILLYGIYVLVFTYAIGELHPEKALLPISMAAIANIALDILLIPNYGLYGICIATTFAHFLAFMLLSIKTKSLRSNYKFLIPLILIPAAYYLNYIGLLLIPLGILMIVKLKLIKRGDLLVIKNTLADILKFKKKEEIEENKD